MGSEGIGEKDCKMGPWMENLGGIVSGFNKKIWYIFFYFRYLFLNLGILYPQLKYVDRIYSV